GIPSLSHPRLPPLRAQPAPQGSPPRRPLPFRRPDAPRLLGHLPHQGDAHRRLVRPGRRCHPRLARSHRHGPEQDQRTTRTCRTRLAYLHQASLYPHLRTPSRATRKICCVKVQELALGPFCPNLDGISVDQLNRFAPGPFSFGPQLQIHVWLLHTCQQLTTLTMIAGSLPNIFAWTRAYWGLGDRSAQK
ncbi:hypothetical protein IWZ01DRAFT_571284, partial [Phyllosticta capitalensis]